MDRLATSSAGPPENSPGLPVQVRRVMPAVVSLVLAALTILALGTIVSNDFILLDDNEYIVNNSLVRSGLSSEGVREAFLSTTRTYIWHPLTWLSHMTDVELFGLRPGPHHAVSLALHIGNTLLLLALLRALTGCLWRSSLVAALFAVHPLHVESVAWASERKDVLSTFFLLCTTLAYVRAVRRNAVRTSLAVPLLYALALLSKSMTVTLPFLLLLLDWWPLGRWAPSRRSKSRFGPLGLLPPPALWLEKAPLFLFAAGAAAITALAQARGAFVARPLAPFFLINALLSYARYLGKALWPHDLIPYYPIPNSWPAVSTVTGALALLVLITIVAFREASRRPYLAVGWLWYLGVLVPVIGLVQSGAQSMADRYTYHSLTGVFIAAVWWIAELSTKRARLRFAVAALSLGLLVMLAHATRVQAARWKNNVTLFGYTLWVDGDNWMALNILGTVLKDQGKLKEAEEHYRRALAGNPLSADAHYNLGVVLHGLGRSEEALSHFRRTLAIRPNGPYVNRAIGEVLVEIGRPEEALEHLQRALAVDARDHVSLVLLGQVLSLRGDAAGAERYFAEARRLAPDDSYVLYSLGDFYLDQGNTEKALATFAQLLRVAPEELELHRTVAAALEAKGLKAEALAHLRALAGALPDRAAARRLLGEALFEQGAFAEAAENLRNAVATETPDAGLLGNYGAALAQLGDYDGALTAFRRSLALNSESIETLLNLARLLRDIGDTEGAADQVLEAYALAPNDSRVTLAVNELLSATGGAEVASRALLRRPRPLALPGLGRERVGQPTSAPAARAAADAPR